MLIARILSPLLLVPAMASAQDAYPTKPVKIIVAYPAGGANDIVARAIGQELAEDLGQPVVIENRSGAAGTIGADAAAKALPDGYTLFMAAGAHTLAPSLHAKLPYDIVTDFQPVSLAATGTYLLVVHPSLPAKSLKELIDLAKARPGALNFASSGVGAPPHLAGVMFQKLAGVTLNHVPYRGDTPAIADLMAGQVQLGFLSIQSLIPQVKAGALRALAVTSGTRSARDARPADGRRVRPARLRHRHLVGPAHAGENAPADRRPSRHGDAQGDRRSRREGALRCRWHRGAERYTAGIRRDDQVRGR